MDESPHSCFLINLFSGQDKYPALRSGIREPLFVLSVNAPLRRERRGGGCYRRAARLFLCPSERPGVKSQLMFIYSADVNTLHSHSGRNTQAHTWQRRAERKSACHCCRFTSLTNASPHKSTTGEDTRYSLRHALQTNWASERDVWIARPVLPLRSWLVYNSVSQPFLSYVPLHPNKEGFRTSSSKPQICFSHYTRFPLKEPNAKTFSTKHRPNSILS